MGLLHPSERTAAGYRIYDDEAAERLRFIKDAHHMGLRLADIKELLDVRDRGRCPCGHTDVLVSKRFNEVEAEITGLEGVRNQLRGLQRRNSECMEATADEWWCAMEQRGGDS